MTVGGNDLNIDLSQIASAISQLEIPARSFLGASDLVSSAFNTSFTSVSGLCEVGEAHGGVLRVNGVESQRAFADRFANIAAQLRQNVA
ncbi:hypothetical protein, partial [Corynebacterium cystitidis]|uniref:hypothetical protein n=1 Tax=Corynebacterium cystitidis TaxID=35757 RepID=UPI00211E2B93